MHPSALIRRALPLALLATSIAAPTLAFAPTIPVLTGDFGDDIRVTDLATRAGNVAVALDVTLGSDHLSGLAWSTDRGATWDDQILADDRSRESQVAWCAGQPTMVFAERLTPPGTQWLLWTMTRDPEVAVTGTRRWTESGISRKPDIACVANTNVALAWFQKQGNSYHVKVKAGSTVGYFPQSFDLGTGSMDRGLSIAASATRVYVSWFAGDKLRVRRFSIGGGSNHSLTSLGTTTVASLTYGDSPQVGADGDRVILAYMDKADLKVRRSTDRGVSFGAAKRLVNEPFPSEVGTRPTSVAVRGSTVAIGAVHFSEQPGSGTGFLSTNGGTSYVKQPSHAGGRLVAGLVKVGGDQRYAEAWDESFSDPNTQHIEFLHR